MLGEPFVCGNDANFTERVYHAGLGCVQTSTSTATSSLVTTFLSRLSMLLLAGWLPLSSQAQTVAADKAGNLFFTDGAGKRTQLTADGRDSVPSLDPARHRVVFVRATPGQTVDVGVGDVEATELWIVDVDGRHATMLLRGKANQKMEKVLGSMDVPQFSPDGQTIYFQSMAWVTSGAIHAYDLARKTDRFVCAGNELEVVPRGEYAGCLLATQHRYFLGGGSYDWYYLLRPNGKEVGVVGEDPETFRATYIKASR